MMSRNNYVTLSLKNKFKKNIANREIVAKVEVSCKTVNTTIKPYSIVTMEGLQGHLPPLFFDLLIETIERCFFKTETFLIFTRQTSKQGLLKDIHI